jgi:hypothetical protein
MWHDTKFKEAGSLQDIHAFDSPYIKYEIQVLGGYCFTQNIDRFMEKYELR